MNPVQKLEAAIAKLERQRRAGTPAPWHAAIDDLTDEVDVWHDQEVRSHVAAFGVANEARAEDDADLVVTLHSTIDPQLDWLRDQLARMRVDVNQQGIPLHYRFSIGLAEAILGGDS